MATAALFVSILAVLVSAVSVAVAVWQGRINARAITREEEDRKAQLTLLREQVRLVNEDRIRERRAHIIAQPRGTSSAGDDRPWQANLELTNVGSSPAHQVTVRLVDEEGSVQSNVFEVTGTLVPDAAVPTPLEVPPGNHRLYPVVSWRDELGPNEERLDLVVTLER